MSSFGVLWDLEVVSLPASYPAGWRLSVGRVLASLGYTRNPVLRSQVVWLSPLLSNNVFIHILRAAHRVHRAGELPPDPGTPLAPTKKFRRRAPRIHTREQ